MEIKKVTVKNLASCPEFANTVAGWIHNQWAKEKYQFDEFSLHMKHFMKKTGLPQTFIAFDEQKPVGTVSLWRNDLKIRQDLCPWLSALWVSSEYRGNLVGHQLVYYAIKRAEKLGYKKLYLVTDLIGYYEKMGWKFIKTEPEGKDHHVRLYSFDVSKKQLLKDLIKGK